MLSKQIVEKKNQVKSLVKQPSNSKLLKTVNTTNQNQSKVKITTKLVSQDNKNNKFTDNSTYSHTKSMSTLFTLADDQNNSKKLKNVPIKIDQGSQLTSKLYERKISKGDSYSNKNTIEAENVNQQDKIKEKKSILKPYRYREKRNMSLNVFNNSIFNTYQEKDILFNLPIKMLDIKPDNKINSTLSRNENTKHLRFASLINNNNTSRPLSSNFNNTFDGELSLSKKQLINNYLNLKSGYSTDRNSSRLTSHLRNTSFHISNKEFDTSKTIKANNLLDRLLIRKEENSNFKLKKPFIGMKENQTLIINDKTDKKDLLNSLNSNSSIATFKPKDYMENKSTVRSTPNFNKMTDKLNVNKYFENNKTKRCKSKYSLIQSGFNHSVNYEKICQDDCFLFTNFNNTENSILFGVINGYGDNGYKASNYIKSQLPKELDSQFLKNKINFDDKDNNACDEIILNTYNKINSQMNKNNDFNYSGCTCSLVIFTGTNITTVNLGDSRVILGRKINNSWNYIDQSRDHNTNDEEESLRIKPLNNNNIFITRSFGYFNNEQFGNISIPEVNKTHLTKGDNFIFSATSGLWKVMSTNEVSLFILIFD